MWDYVGHSDAGQGTETEGQKEVAQDREEKESTSPGSTSRNSNHYAWRAWSK